MHINHEAILGEFISLSERFLRNNELDEVRHYYEHGEYEMAFEGLLIELTSLGIYPDNFKFSKWKEIAIHYGLDKESIFDEFIWEKFMRWGADKNL